MPSTHTVKVVERRYSNCLRLEWWAKEGSARNDHERRASQYDRKSDMAAIGAMARQACKGCHPAVPTGNPKWLTSPRESVDNRPDGRSLQVDLGCYSRAIPVADGIAR
jgi:hypothetical protein